MDALDFGSDRFWLLLAGAIVIAFILGRTVRRRRGDDGERRMRDEAEAARRYDLLSLEARTAIDALAAAGKTIEAIKYVRERTGLGLKEAKDVVDARKRALKGG